MEGTEELVNLMRALLIELRAFNENIRTGRQRLHRPEQTVRIDSAAALRLIAIRKRLGFNQAQWGAKIGRSQVGVSAWERGRVAIPFSVLEDWAEMGNVTVDWLLYGEEKSSED